MERTVDDIRNEFIDTVGEISEWTGFTRVAGLLKGLLLVAREPMCLTEMADRLEVSKAAVSTNIRVLERWRIVRRVYSRGDRRNYYELRGDLWDIETDLLTTLVRDELKRFADMVTGWKRGLEGATDGDPADRAFLEGRMDQIEEYLDAAGHVISLLTREKKVTPAVIKKIKIG